MFTNFIELSNVKLYIDPATTSYIIQIAAGIIIAAGAGIGVFWSKLKRALFKKKNDTQDIPEINMDDSVKAGGKDVITAEDLLNGEDD